MMKKAYKTPLVRVCMLEAETVLASSGDGVKINDNPGTFEGNVNEREDFDDIWSAY